MQLISNFNLWAPLCYLGHGVVPGPHNRANCGPWVRLCSPCPLFFPRLPLWSYASLLIVVPGPPCGLCSLLGSQGPIVIPWSHCEPLYPICSPDSLSHMWVIGPLAFPGPPWSQGPVTAQGSIRIPWPCCGLQAPIVVPGPSCGPWAPVWSSFPL